jgi:hypothetical protein
MSKDHGQHFSNKYWAIGRAVERALDDTAEISVYQNSNGDDDWWVRVSNAAPPPDFTKRYAVQCQFPATIGRNEVVVREVRS